MLILLLRASVQVQVSLFPTSFTHEKRTEAVAKVSAYGNCSNETCSEGHKNDVEIKEHKGKYIYNIFTRYKGSNCFSSVCLKK